MRSIQLVKQSNALFLMDRQAGPCPDDIVAELHPLLTYTKTERQYVRSGKGWRGKIVKSDQRLFTRTQEGWVATGFGLVHDIAEFLRSRDLDLVFRDLDADAIHPRPGRYEADINNVLVHFAFRERQEECLAQVSKNFFGIIHAATGFGKMVMICMVCLLYPKAKIHIVTRRVPIVNKLVDMLSEHIPNVGKVGDGSKTLGDRVTVFTAASLGYSDFDADLLLCDEAHELMSDDTVAKIVCYRNSRNFAFTATPIGRSDGTDSRLPYLFGRTIFYLPYWEAERLGLVAPISVYWRDVVMDYNPTRDANSDVERSRLGIWFNEERNDIIAADVGQFCDEAQTLVLVDRIHHAMELYRRLRSRGFRLVYGSLDAERFEGYRAADILPADEPPMTAARKESLRKEFEAGNGNFIATSTWSVGIDPTNLSHLFLAAPYGGEIAVPQAAGRAARLSASGNKLRGYVHDYRDQFDPGFRRAAKGRQKIYESLRWEQVLHTGTGLIPLERG